MAATIHQGANPANLRVNEAASITFYYKAATGDDFSLLISPREKADLKIEDLTVNVSQMRTWTRKKKVTITVVCLETDFPFLLQLYYYMQQPCKCQFVTPEGEFFNFVPNGTSNAAQVDGSATGSNIGSLNFDFTNDPNNRQVTLTFSTELSMAEYTYLLAHRAAGVAGTDISGTLHTTGTLANATNGQESYVVPDWNSLSITNTGGTDLAGVIKTGKLSIKSEGEVIKDNIMYGQRLIADGEFKLGSVSTLDLQAFHGDTKEGTTIIANDYAGGSFKFVNVAAENLILDIGDTASDITVKFKGATVYNPDDSATPPANIDIGITDPLIFQMNLVNN